MAKIHKLPLHEVQKIAAGEVVERPANVVKELIENAIDADARTIEIAIEDAGKKLISIIDDGCGMDEEDAQLCFAQHATSKITSVHDLQSINTFGFRGEALASIAAVSNVDLITKTADVEYATQVTVTCGTITNTTETSAPTGTKIIIHDLFCNVPARKKFLKTSDTERRQIMQLIEAYALNYHHIHFKLHSDGKLIHNLPAAESVLQRLTQLHNHQYANQFLNISAHSTDGKIHINGVISDHQLTRYNRNDVIFFVNRRWVKNFKIGNAIIQGYQHVLPAGKYPAAAIFITIDSQHVDINIHPRKEEVQFLNPRIVEQLLTKTIKQALEDNLSQKIKRPVAFSAATIDYQETKSVPSFEPKVAPTPLHKTVFNPFDFDPLPIKHESASTGYIPAPNPFEHLDEYKTAPAPLLEQPAVQQSAFAATPEQQEPGYNQEYRFIGVHNKTYILLETPEGLMMVDQHAAHERVLYEVFSKRFEDIATIRLMFPQTIALSPDEIQLLVPHLALFHENGIAIEQFSDNQLVVHATPVHLKSQPLDELCKQAVSWIKEHQELPAADFAKGVHNKLRAQMACKAAVKAGDELSESQITQLLDDLYKTENRLTCPHGRPTGWLLRDYEIEKKFKRKL